MCCEQTYSLNVTNPNDAGLLPDNQNLAAFFYQDPAVELYNEWRWSVSQKQWYQTVAPA